MKAILEQAFHTGISSVRRGTISSAMGMLNQSLQTRTLHSSNTKKPILRTNTSLGNEFLRYTQEIGGRYIPEREGFAWRTDNPQLQQIVEHHFKEVSNTLGIPSATPANTTPHYTSTEVTARRSLVDLVSTLSRASVASISAGGLPALWVAYLQSILYKEGAFDPALGAPTYVMPPNLKSSAAYGSSLQFHVSHASPMYTDRAFSVPKILAATLRRNFLPESENPEKDNYMIAEIHPSAFFKLDVLQVGLGYFYHEIQYKLRSQLGLPTILDENIPLAITSGQVMDRVAEELGQPVLLRKNTIRVAYNEEETAEMLELQSLLKQYGVECRQVSEDEVQQTAGVRPRVGQSGSIWQVEGDGNVTPHIVTLLTDAIRRNGGQIIEGWLEHVVYDPQKKEVVGVAVNNHAPPGDSTQTFIHGSRLFTSFGARARYTQDGSVPDFQPVEPIISGTGYSAYLIVEGEVNQPIDSNNSHFTPLKVATLPDGNKITLVKASCGGAIGTDSFCIDHARNNLFYAAEVIFPDRKIELYAAKSCSRPLNAQNSGKLQEVVPGFFAATGFGGKGITDAPGFALQEVTAKLVAGQAEPERVQSFVERYTKQNREAEIARTG